jgi:uncharacterized protein (DUF2236 family)
MDTQIPQQPFTPASSIMRTIWGNSDTIMIVFAGSAAEFALNRAVDWLFFTGGIPNDPIGRFFSTARFAQEIAFADEQTAERTLKRINAIHSAVEHKRASHIPDWAHRDVLYMLIDYSERAYELLHRRLTTAEQEDLYTAFLRIGERLHITNLPPSYASWRQDRQLHLERDLVFSSHTTALYEQYRRHLGTWRYRLLLQLQSVIVPEHVRRMLQLPHSSSLAYSVALYPLITHLGLRPFLQRLLIPPRHLRDLRQLDLQAAGR